jgi:ABC-2 type transport system ATP-binding protein
MSVLSVRKLRKVYPGDPPFVAVNDISFELKEGEILGLLGPNGAGKTTTIQMLMSTLTSTSGDIVYFGKDFESHRSEILKDVAFASTYVSLPANLTVEQNLEVFGRLYGVPVKKLHQRRDELLDRFGIYSKRKSRVSQLSAGQVTRLMLVKAFMIDPKIALLDEPTASLDPDMAKIVCSFVLEERKKHGTSILFTSHNMTEVAEVCDRVLFLQNGNIVADDLPRHLARSVSTTRLKLVAATQKELIGKLAQEFGYPFTIDHRTIEIEIKEEEIALFLQRLATEGISFTSIDIIQPTLEDYFLSLAGGVS